MPFYFYTPVITSKLYKVDDDIRVVISMGTGS